MYLGVARSVDKAVILFFMLLRYKGSYFISPLGPLSILSSLFCHHGCSFVTSHTRTYLSSDLTSRLSSRFDTSPKRSRVILDSGCFVAVCIYGAPRGWEGEWNLISDVPVCCPRSEGSWRGLSHGHLYLQSQLWRLVRRHRIDWLTDWWTDWQTHWLTDALIDGRIDWRTSKLTD